uniref:(California timema) hypothetical protein n=1 Tax=Timema californicum TaxID=61474 RepID=A0A7R9JAC1_TIMCA|nr:unnamed protein product [Timema californicum]
MVDMIVRVFVNNHFWDLFMFDIDGVVMLSENISSSRFLTCPKSSLVASTHSDPQNTQKLALSGHTLSAFLALLKLSRKFRELVLANFKSHVLKSQGKVTSISAVHLRVRLVQCREYVDYAWGQRMERLALERRELAHAMSWLSTLGGAFSALGDRFSDHAETAGRISLKQLLIASRLGDPAMVARCRLYLSLSLIQRGNLVQAKHIVQQQYKWAKCGPVVDTILVRMCLGIWAKLKYSYKLRRSNLVRKNGRVQV